MSVSPRKFSNYLIGRKLGQGGQGKVFLAVQADDPLCHPYAIKILFPTLMSHSQREMLKNEIEIVNNLNHPNISKFLGIVWNEIWTKKNGKEIASTIGIISEVAKGGQLFDYLNLKPFPLEIAQFYATQLVTSVAYCHELRVAHRDLKAENLLIKDEETFDLTVIDFGLAKVKNDDARFSLMTTAIGTKTYWAPEIHLVKAGELDGYDGLAMDNWAVGVLIFIFLFGVPPTDGSKAFKCPFLLMIRESRWDLFWFHHKRFAKNSFCARLMEDPICRDFIQALLTFNSSTRMQCSQALKHPFLVDYVPKKDVIIAEMLRRKTEVGQALRNQARENAIRRGTLVPGMPEFEPFSFEVHRSSKSLLPIFDSGAPALPIPSDFVHHGRFTDFYSDRFAIEIYNELTKATKKMGKIVEKENYKLQIQIESVDGEMVIVNSKIFFDAKKNLHLITVDRKAGSIISFQKVYQMILDEVGIIIYEPEKLEW